MKKAFILLLVILAIGGTACGSKEDGRTPVPEAAVTPSIPPEVSVTPDSSAGEATPSPEIPILDFTVENFPKLDGSTANVPMAKLMLKKILGLSESQSEKLTDFATTPYAYENLINKESDLLLVYEADAATKQSIKESGVELEYHPIGKDALVFIINEKNSVKSLTELQLQDIYQGRLTNWKEAGGADLKIEAFQRPELSGSQALMRKLVMREKEMTNAPAYYYPGGMAGLIGILAEYKNTGSALGYSVYYYAKNMEAREGLKFVGVNGVLPSNETIQSGAYPYVNEFYAVIRAEEPADSNTRKLLNWILSSAGKETVEEAGYVSMN